MLRMRIKMIVPMRYMDQELITFQQLLKICDIDQLFIFYHYHK